MCGCVYWVIVARSFRLVWLATFHFYIIKIYKCLKIFECKSVYALIPKQQYFPNCDNFIIATAVMRWSKQFSSEFMNGFTELRGQIILHLLLLTF